MPRNRESYHHGDLRNALLTEALALIGTHGPEALTLRQLARALGVDHTAVYRHFSDKGALLSELSDTGFALLAERMRGALVSTDDDPVGRVRSLAVAYVSFAIDHASHFRVMLGPRSGQSPRDVLGQRRPNEAFALLRDAIDDGQRRGLLVGDDPVSAAVTVWTIGHGYAALVLTRRVRVQDMAVAQAYFARVLEPVLRGLAASQR